MNKKQLAEVMDQVIKEISFLREEGQKEYAHADENAFRNFEALSADLNGLSREKVLWVYLKKHLDGILAHINGHKSQREPVFGRINDSIVYLIILYAMCVENTNTSRDKAVVDYSDYSELHTVISHPQNSHRSFNQLNDR